MHFNKYKDQLTSIIVNRCTVVINPMDSLYKKKKKKYNTKHKLWLFVNLAKTLI